MPIDLSFASEIKFVASITLDILPEENAFVLTGSREDWAHLGINVVAKFLINENAREVYLVSAYSSDEMRFSLHSGFDGGRPTREVNPSIVSHLARLTNGQERRGIKGTVDKSTTGEPVLVFKL